MTTAYFNEMFQDGQVRAPYARLEDWTRAMPAEFRQMKQAEAEQKGQYFERKLMMVTRRRPPSQQADWSVWKADWTVWKADWPVCFAKIDYVQSAALTNGDWTVGFPLPIQDSAASSD